MDVRGGVAGEGLQAGYPGETADPLPETGLQEPLRIAGCCSTWEIIKPPQAGTFQQEKGAK